MSCLAVELPSVWGQQTSPIEVDVGCHRGTFLVAMAESYPERRFLGIERQPSRVERCLKKIGRLGLQNAYAVQGEELSILRELELRVRVIHVSFPDPWPKRRHHVRRMVNGRFLAEAWSALEPEGTLRLMTDDESYFRAMERDALAFDGFEPVAWDDARTYPPTEFEMKFVGKPVYRRALRRCDSTSSE